MQGRPVLAVRRHEVVAPNVARGRRKRQPDTGGHLEERSPFGACRGDQSIKEVRELRWRGKRGDAFPQLSERVSYLGEFEGRQVDDTRGGASGALQRADELVDGAEVRALPEQAGGGELILEHPEVDTGAVEYVRGASEQPER